MTRLTPWGQVDLLLFIADNPMRGGLAVALAISVPHLFLPLDWSVALAALTLAVIAGVYIGFAVLHGREHAFVAEAIAAVTFAALALGGMMVSPWIIPVGLVGHAIWDMLHHRRTHFLTDVPGWYVPFCIVIDVILALVLAVSWAGGT